MSSSYRCARQKRKKRIREPTSAENVTQWTDWALADVDRRSDHSAVSLRTPRGRESIFVEEENHEAHSVPWSVALRGNPQGGGVRVNEGVRRTGMLPRRVGKGWSLVKPHWYAGALTLTCGLFLANAWHDQSRDRRATTELQYKLGAMALQGGGVFVVTGAGECVATLQAIGNVARRLMDSGVSVGGLVLQDGTAPEVFEAVLEAANERFPHEPVRWEAIQPLARITGLPALFGVSSEGRVTFVEHVSSLVRANPTGAEEAAERLAARLDIS